MAAASIRCTRLADLPAAMGVMAPDDGARWDYRRKATARIHAAMRALAVGRSELGERRTLVP